MNLLPQGERLLSGQLSEYLSAVGTTVDVDNPPSALKLPTYIEIDPDSDNPETVRVIDVSGNTLTIERGVYNGGIGVEHQANTTWKQKFSQMHWDAVVQAIQNGYLTEDSIYDLAKVDSNTFTITGVDRTPFATTGRILRLNGNVYVTVLSSTYGAGATTININETTVPTTITSLEYAIQPEGSDFVSARKATGAEVNTGTNDEKIVTPKAVADSNIELLKVTTVTESAEPAINTDVTNVAHITGLAQAITSMTTNLTGTPAEGDTLRIDITDDGTARAITWGAKFEDSAVALPLTTVLGQRLDIILRWNSVTSKWRCVHTTVAPATAIITTTKYAPQGFLLNGKIVPSVASNNLTVAIKGLDGNDPSASNPVYVRIGDTVRTITSALSVTKNAGTNWFNAGSSELATKEIDYFVYLGYNTTDGVVIGFSRIPYSTSYGEFSATSTNEKYCAISTITNASSTDYYELVGRFGATLSAGAGYTWTVPTFTAINLVQRPIYRTRQLTYTPTLSLANPPTSLSTDAFYVLDGQKVSASYQAKGTANASNAGQNMFVTVPFTARISSVIGNAMFAGIGLGIWSDGVGFTDMAVNQYWFNQDNNFLCQFASTTRKPTQIGMRVEYFI